MFIYGEKLFGNISVLNVGFKMFVNGGIMSYFASFRRVVLMSSGSLFLADISIIIYLWLI